MATTATNMELSMRSISNSLLRLVLGFSSAVLLSGCSTMQSAYHSSVDTVTGWFKSDEKKEEKK